MSVDQERRTVARELAPVLRHRDFRSALTAVTDAHGAHPIVVALPDDSLEYVFDRVHVMGGDALVVASMPPGALSFLHFKSVEGLHQFIDVGEEDCPVHRDASLGVLLAYLRTFRRKVVCHVTDPEIQVELVEDGGGLDVPAV